MANADKAMANIMSKSSMPADPAKIFKDEPPARITSNPSSDQDAVSIVKKQPTQQFSEVILFIDNREKRNQ